MAFFMPGDKKIGVTNAKRQYDLPLNTGGGAGFLVLLVALMTFLGVMALAATFALSSLAHQWSSGLENKMTIEIPAEITQKTKNTANNQNRIRSPEEIAQLATQIKQRLDQQNFVQSVHVLSPQEISDLIAPWLGDAASIPDMPLPGLISVELIGMNEEIFTKMKSDLEKIVPNIALDRHESWLADILKLTGALQFSTILVSLLIGVTTITAIAGAVKSRIAIHRSDVELLHLMGASDGYISRQFQRHTLILALKGATSGTLCGAIVLTILGWIAGDTGASLMPEVQITMVHIFTLLALPIAACMIAGITARFTVLRELAQMP